MARDFNKAITDGRTLAQSRHGLDIKATEIYLLYSMFKEDAEARGVNEAAMTLIDRAYSAGLAIGNRNA